jgi:hypothetical protein
MNKFLKYIYNNPGVAAIAPKSLKKWVKSLVSMTDYYHAVWAKENEFVGTDKEWEYKGTSTHTVGIIYDPAHYHMFFQYACVDLGFSYKVIDIRTDDWATKIQESGCSAFVMWPLLETFILKEMCEERWHFIQNYMKKPVFPSHEEIWMLNNKRKIRDFLQINGFEPPQTWCFYKKEDADDFIETAPIPIVFKSIHEGVSRGVIICRTRQEAKDLIKECFTKGFVPRRTNPRNKQWDFILFQEYLPDVEERRMIRIGDTYIAIDKVRKGDFHSGSGTMKWANSERYFLDMIKKITDKGNFKSMNVDFFIAKDGRILVNELHTVFHGPTIHTVENKGIHTYDAVKDEWNYTPGNQYRNYCCNLRMLEVADMINETNIDRISWLDKSPFGY